MGRVQTINMYDTLTMLMNELIIICAKYLLFVSALIVIVALCRKGITKRGVKNFVVIFGSATLAWVVAHILKGIIAHPRPDLAVAIIMSDDTYSFPSGHATFMFALASSYLYLIGNNRTTKLLFALALATGIARVLAGIHFWYDIIGGLVLGACVAYALSLLAKKYL